MVMRVVNRDEAVYAVFDEDGRRVGYVVHPRVDLTKGPLREKVFLTRAMPALPPGSTRSRPRRETH